MEISRYAPLTAIENRKKQHNAAIKSTDLPKSVI